MKQFIVIGGVVTSSTDGERHYISPQKLMKLYRVRPSDCVTFTCVEEFRFSYFSDIGGFTILEPRYDGNYQKPPFNVEAAVTYCTSQSRLSGTHQEWEMHKSCIRDAIREALDYESN